MSKRVIAGCLGFLLVVIFSPTLLFAQQGTAELGGKVVDAQGGVLPGVSITITNEDTGVVRETVSGPEGSYFAAQLVPGRYRIQSTLEGFKTLDRRGVTLISPWRSAACRKRLLSLVTRLSWT